jgi:hypothetical protein
MLDSDSRWFLIVWYMQSKYGIETLKLKMDFWDLPAFFDIKGTKLIYSPTPLISQDSSVSTATDYRLDGWVSIPGSIQTSSGARPAPYPMDIGGKGAGTWSWPLTAILHRGQEWLSNNSTPTYILMVWWLIY